MNDKHDPARRAETGPVAPPVAAVSIRRRRLLKIGAGAAPASLLLVGRPVHAQYTCVSTSAWGSQMISTAASVAARRTGTTIVAWSIAEWQSNSTHGSLNNPWSAAGASTEDEFKAKTIADVGITTPPRGTDGSTLVYGVLTGNDNFARAMLVALLNATLLQSNASGPQLCISLATLGEMASGSYAMPAGNGWSEQDIIDYLQINGLAA